MHVRLLGNLGSDGGGKGDVCEMVRCSEDYRFVVDGIGALVSCQCPVVMRSCGFWGDAGHLKVALGE